MSSLLGAHLLNGSEERVRLVESVQEANGPVNCGWVILPQVKHFKALLQVIEPRSETSSGHPRFLGPLSTDLVHGNVFHEVLHSGRHGQLSLEGKIKIFQVIDNLSDESVNQLTFLDIDRLIRSTGGFIRQLTHDLFKGKLLLFDLCFFEDTLGEFLGDIDDSGCTIRATTTLRLKLSKDNEQVVTLGGKEINLSVGMHSEGKRSLWRQFIFNVLKIFAMNLGNGALERSFTFGEGEELSLVKELIVEEVL